MGLTFNKNLQKEQVHGLHVKMRNFRGVFTNPAGLPGGALANDHWLFTGSTTSFSGLMLRNGDHVIKLDDGYAELTPANLAAKRWEIRRNLTAGEITFLENAAAGIVYADEIRPKTLTGEGIGGQTGTVKLNGIDVKQNQIDLGTF